jgi:hypothetical protein
MRAKIILPNLLVVLLLGLGGFFYLRADLYNSAEKRLTARVGFTRILFDRSEALEGYELLSAIGYFAMSKTAISAFETPNLLRKPEDSDESFERLMRVSRDEQAINAVANIGEEWKAKKGKAPDILFLTDVNGVVIARNTNPRACPAGKNVSDAIPTVKRALEGEATYSLWSISDSPFSAKATDPAFCQLLNTELMEVASAPVWVDETIQGVLVVGTEISNGTARKNAEIIGLDMAVLKNGGVYSSSLTTDTQRQALEQELAQAHVVQKIDQAVATGIPSETFEIKVVDESFIALIAPAPNADKKDKIVNILLGSRNKETSYLGSIKMLLVFLALGVLAVFIVGLVLANHFLKPVMFIEEGLLKIINGETTYRFDVKSSELGGLGYRINQLVSYLTDEEETPDEGQSS